MEYMQIEMTNWNKYLWDPQYFLRVERAIETKKVWELPN